MCTIYEKRIQVFICFSFFFPSLYTSGEFKGKKNIFTIYIHNITYTITCLLVKDGILLHWNTNILRDLSTPCFLNLWTFGPSLDLALVICKLFVTYKQKCSEVIIFSSRNIVLHLWILLHIGFFIVNFPFVCF